jgi:hypothetical protein
MMIVIRVHRQYVVSIHVMRVSRNCQGSGDVSVLSCNIRRYLVYGSISIYRCTKIVIYNLRPVPIGGFALRAEAGVPCAGGPA